MAIHEVIFMGNPVLRQIASEVTATEILSDSMKAFIEDMVDTMEDQEGIGLAAPQISVSKQIVIIRLPEDPESENDLPKSPLFVLFNPKVKVLDSSSQGCWEGCLSVPGLKGYVERPCKIEIEYLDQKAQKQIFVAEDFLATVFQHELDHLEGILYIDKLKSTHLLSYCEEFDEFIAPQLSK